VDWDAVRTVDVDSFDELLDAYYARRGWSHDGIPTGGTLAELDLLGAVDDETPVATRPAR